MAERNQGQKPVVVGRTWADLVHGSETGPKLDAAMARIVDFATDVAGVAADRVRRVLGIVDRHLEAASAEPKAIPERVAIPVIEAVGLEDREELHELWAKLLVASATGASVDAFFIDIVRKLDPTSAKLLAALGRAVLDAEQLYPSEEGGAGYGVGDYGDADIDGSGSGDTLEDHMLARTYPVERARGRHTMAVTNELLPDKAERDLALARLLALGLIQDAGVVPFPAMAPAGWHLLRLIGA